ncbi:MAG: helix-turn-helix domain-containing protein, partial [Christensenellaceae bacterium]|nr:helix-turn-helix domain-containing protein [Christensenellaceae bacterium]
MGKQLGYNERKFIEKQVKRKVKKSEIARVLGVSHTTVGREVNNEKNWEWERVGKKVIKRYSAKKAQSNYENNKMRCGAKYKFIQDSKWLEYI